MKNSLNEELNRINFLFDYQKGRVVSEQLIQKTKQKIGDTKTASTEEITPESVSESKQWLISNNYDSLFTEFDRKNKKGRGNSILRTWKKNADQGISSKEELTPEQSEGVFMLKFALESYVNAKESSKKKIKIISISKGQTTEEVSEDKVDKNQLPKELAEVNTLTGPTGLFQDNSTEPTANLDSSIDEIIKGLEIKKQEFIKENPQFAELSEVMLWECTDVIVETSSSRYANTGSAEKLNFLSLSKMRAEKGYSKIIQLLNSKGVLFGDTYEKNKTLPGAIDYTGKNGDGSSGPPPPNGKSMSDLRFEGKLNAPRYVKSDSPEYKKLFDLSVKNYGNPLENPNDYSIYKYFNFKANFQLVIRKEYRFPQPEKKVVTYGEYKIFFLTTKWSLKIKFPKLSLKLISGGMKNSIMDACPRF